MRELIELTNQKVDRLIVNQEQQNKANFSDKLCMDYFLPFKTNSDVDDFMKKDADFHRRKLGIREVNLS